MPQNDKRPEEQLLSAAGSLCVLLVRGAGGTADLVLGTAEEAVRRGRTTGQDVEDLAQNVVAIGRRQTRDALAEVEGLVGRSASQTLRVARGAGEAARRAPGGDRTLRTVDRARRTAGVGPAFPIVAYDALTVAQIDERLGALRPPELRRVRDHERRNANREAVLTAIEIRLA